MPDLSQLVTRIASALQIEYAEAAVLARRIVPVLNVEDLDEMGAGADTATRWCWRGVTQAGAGGLLSACGLVNPATSGMRLICEGFRHEVSATRLMSAGKGATVAGTIAQGRYRDGGPGVPAGQTEAIATAGVGVDDITWQMTAIDGWINMPVVIDPGENLRVQINSPVNVILRVAWFWKEIKLPTLV